MPNLITLFLTLSLLSIPSSSQQDEFTFIGFNDVGTNITLSQSSIFLENGILKLTNDTSRLMGHGFYTSLLQFKNISTGKAYSFSTCFAIAIVPEYPKLGGHGLAFALSSSIDLKTALPSQYLGLLNSSDLGNITNHLFAVEFDTVQDFEFGDISDNHVGINIDSLVSNQSANATYVTDDMSKRDLRLQSGEPIMVWLDYDSDNTLINVTISPSAKKPVLPILSYKCDLSEIINEKMFVGFSASTGLLASSHYVLGWSFKMNGKAESLSLDSLPKLPQPKKKQTALILGVSLSSFVLFLGLVVIAFYLVWKIKNRDVIEDWELERGPHRYSYQELKQATKGFKNSELLGVGGFGSVYKGTLPKTNTQIAVKRISHDSNQGLQEFVSEIASIGKLRHRNLVQLLGWCRRRADLLLVYDFMPNGSLDKYLFYENEFVLNWEQRFKIIKGVASALLYLHEGYEQVVIHRDVKASNVLLDGEFNGKLGDFGLARLYEHGSNPGTTRVVGTLGYLAPEIPRTGKATPKSDVFGFGAFLLEVVCGRRPIEPKVAHEELVLVDWTWEKLRKGNVLDVVDPKMGGEFDEAEVAMVLKLGMMCSNEVALARPGMREVVRYLEGEIVVPADLKAPYVDRGNNEVVFDDFVNSFASSSFDKSSFRKDVGTTFGSVSSSPISLLFNTR